MSMKKSWREEFEQMEKDVDRLKQKEEEDGK